MVALDHGRVVFKAFNRHSESCGVPPMLTGASNNYCGYFENEHGEQWLFNYDREARKGMLYGGDIGWGNPREVRDGQPPIQMTDAESRWLQSCWEAATKFARPNKEG